MFVGGVQAELLKGHHEAARGWSSGPLEGKNLGENEDGGRLLEEQQLVRAARN